MGELHRWSHRRFASGPNSTIGELRDWDRQLVSYLLEDQFQPYGQKIPGKTRIPPGLYEILVRPDSPKFAHYYDAEWSRDWFRGMPWLTDVEDDGEGFELEHFEWVYYHPGNDDDDSAGCPLTGDEYELTTKGDYRIKPGTSRRAFQRLCERVYRIVLDGDDRLFVRVSGDEDLED